MLPYRVSNPGPLTYESGALPIALRGPAFQYRTETTSWPLLQVPADVMLLNPITRQFGAQLDGCTIFRLDQ